MAFVLKNNCKQIPFHGFKKNTSKATQEMTFSKRHNRGVSCGSGKIDCWKERFCKGGVGCMGSVLKNRCQIQDKMVSLKDFKRKPSTAMFQEEQEAAYTTILDSPSAPNIVARLQTALEAERQRRQQFYKDIDDDMKVEFINGEVVVHSPVKKEHTDATGFLYQILNPFVRLAKLGYVGHEKILTALSRNDYEPDVVFFGKEKAKKFKKGQWKFPPPDFVVEVLSKTTESRDRGIKFDDYESHGVQEYWIINPVEETVEQYLLQDGKFKLRLKSGEGIIKSEVIEGFSIDIRAVFDEKANMEALRRIMGL